MEYVSSKTVREYFGWTRAMCSRVALREGWRIKDGQRPHFYVVQDVNDYLISREHTQRADEQGLWRSRGLIRHKDGYSAFCPICQLTNP